MAERNDLASVFATEDDRAIADGRGDGSCLRRGYVPVRLTPEMVALLSQGEAGVPLRQVTVA